MNRGTIVRLVRDPGFRLHPHGQRHGSLLPRHRNAKSSLSPFDSLQEGQAVHVRHRAGYRPPRQRAVRVQARELGRLRRSPGASGTGRRLPRSRGSTPSVGPDGDANSHGPGSGRGAPVSPGRTPSPRSRSARRPRRPVQQRSAGQLVDQLRSRKGARHRPLGRRQLHHVGRDHPGSAAAARSSQVSLVPVQAARLRRPHRRQRAGIEDVEVDADVQGPAGRAERASVASQSRASDPSGPPPRRAPATRAA